jgi:hypothetical protein
VKILLVVLVGVVFLIVAVAAIGALLPKQHVVSRSASYRASAEKLFSLIAGSQTWRPDVLHCELSSDADGRELLRETTRGGETITYAVLDRVPPKSLKRQIVTQNLPYSGTWTYALTTAGETTVVRITENGEVYNPIFRFVSRFVVGHTSTIDAYLRALGKATGQEVVITN